MKIILFVLIIISSLNLKAQHVDGALYTSSGTKPSKGAYVRSTNIKIVKSPKLQNAVLDKSNTDSPFSINPNPSTDHLFLNNLFNYKILNIIIYDEKGNKVSEADLLSAASKFEI